MTSKNCLINHIQYADGCHVCNPPAQAAVEVVARRAEAAYTRITREEAAAVIKDVLAQYVLEYSERGSER